MSGQRRFGLIVIGDEILSGKRRDGHFAEVIGMLAERGLELAWARFVSDAPDLVTRTLSETFASGDVVFSCGGIGATPDDRTRQCAAEALGVSLAVHPDGERELEARFGRPVEPPERLRLVTFPEGSAIIPNPVNRIPGFAVHEHYFVPGFPNMAWPMMEWVLDSHYAALQSPGAHREMAITVPGARESHVIPLMEAFEAEHPGLRLSCLPATEPGQRYLELGLRGEVEAVTAGLQDLIQRVEALGFGWQYAPVARPARQARHDA
jgi:molybdopterin-biosynthesis enzyme MoeA-like protein